MPTHSDHGQSELDFPELEPPSVVEVELEPDDDEESESLPEWETNVAIGTLKNSVAHAFCASLYASCLFQPVILSLNLK